jgi:ParB family chromosome partitioning protein
MLGVSQSYVANKLRLLKLDESMRERIIKADLSERHARAILHLKSDEDRSKALDKICERGFSVAESEALVDMLSLTEVPTVFGKAKALSAIDAFIDSIKQSLAIIRSSGADAKSKINYENNKVYISICIDENGVL